MTYGNKSLKVKTNYICLQAIKSLKKSKFEDYLVICTLCSLRRTHCANAPLAGSAWNKNSVTPSRVTIQGRRNWKNAERGGQSSGVIAPSPSSFPGSDGSACYLKDKTVTLSTKSAKHVLSSYQTLKQIMRVKEHTYSSSSSIVVSLNSKLVSKQIGTGWTINYDVVFWCMNIWNFWHVIPWAVLMRQK